ncbi:DUF6461 domain-containing protein [Streptomyces sp. NPDC002668]|uniref:DUF6461 domain-containing protein n=1 Tax=Streptomyces sp. NPDC002668 TaxID=3154422 RepID=UPI00331E6F5C
MRRWHRYRAGRQSSRTSGTRDYALHTEATFAPAERITGVLPTPELLRTSEFVCGTVPIPDH